MAVSGAPISNGAGLLWTMIAAAVGLQMVPTRL